MATRGNVIVKSKYSKVVLYQHWDGYNLKDKVIKALKEYPSRWDDVQYLAANIFREMIRGEEHTGSGFGISSEVFDGDVFVVVDVDKQTVNNQPFEEAVEKPKKQSAWMIEARTKNEKRSAAQKERQKEDYREHGKYAKVNPCYVCGKSAGVNYNSHPGTDHTINDELLVLCDKCMKKLEKLPGPEAVKVAQKMQEEAD